jgi:hypothetical protein
MRFSRIGPITAGAAAVLLSLAAATAAQPACPSQDFDAFLKAFTTSVKTQVAFTARPLRFERVDSEAQPEPATVVEMLDGDKLAFPVMPTVKEQAAEKFEMATTRISETEMETTLFVPETDYQLRFGFRKTDCWELFKKADDSL